ncbi:hypothetical protein EVAR_67548_1 [Eumeta japonica]|uniref:Uncharacterized protein n=1 Tax=Eumeta variegata TaxID=151549 RepID=A0A4C2A028_EUMVA|nr:hypothetical protein EVAR_67548_1 [Eumeta japonica]
MEIKCEDAVFKQELNMEDAQNQGYTKTEPRLDEAWDMAHEFTKTENEMDAVMIKQELDIGPAVLTPQTVPCPSPSVQACPSPHYSNISSDGASLCASILAQPATRTNVEKYLCGGDRGAPSSVNLQLDLKRTDDTYQSTKRENS